MTGRQGKMVKKERREEVASVVLRPTTVGSRAVFLVEARGTEEQRKARELFQALGQLAEVATLCDGPLLAFVVQFRADERGSAPNSLFGKIEAALRDEFAFSLVERSFNEVVYHLVASLSDDSGGQMQPIPRCGICNEREPFPTRVTMHDTAGRGIIEACYCARCSAQQADPSDRKYLSGLLAADRYGDHGLSDSDLIDWYPETEAGHPLLTCRIAS